MSDLQKQIKHHQIELERLKKQLPSLSAAAKDAKRFYAKNRINRAPYPREIIDAFDDAKSAIEGHATEIKRIQRLIEWDDGTRFASTNIKKAQKEISQVQSDLQKLQDKRLKLSTKLQKLEDEKRAEVEKAQYAEKQAAASYAVALSDGDEADEQRAEKALRLASEALATANRGKRGVATTAQALKNEVEKLDEEITEIKEVLKDLRQRQLRVARIMWADRLDKAAQEFAAVAAHLEATEKALGWTSSMSELYVPLQTPHGPACISQKTISDKAYALSMEQLLAA
ncbi:hypothetical protein ACEN9D_11705 [Pseudomonas sp. CT11-2]|uniref:hypothetical protein n=1 Tax=Pseudomonas sp. CT11-2 TaxID=3243023 RepID=UPI0039AFB4EC